MDGVTAGVSINRGEHDRPDIHADLAIGSQRAIGPPDELQMLLNGHSLIKRWNVFTLRSETFQKFQIFAPVASAGRRLVFYVGRQRGCGSRANDIGGPQRSIAKFRIGAIAEKQFGLCAGIWHRLVIIAFDAIPIGHAGFQ